MTISPKTLQQMARNTGRSIGAKAMQRLEQEVANFKKSNDLDDGDEETFRQTAHLALYEEVNIAS